MTAPAEVPYTPFRADRMRLTRLDGCGAPVTGPKTTLVTDGLISVEWKAEIDSGNDVEVKNAKGALKVSSPGLSIIKYITPTLTLVGVDPEAYELVTGQQLVTNGQGQPVGINGQESISAAYGVAVETWTEVGTEDGDCGPDGLLYGYFLLPFVTKGQIGDMTLNDGAMDCVLMGRTKRGSQWGTGPATYLVADSSVDGTSVTPAVLATAIGPTDHFRIFSTPVPPPDVTAGAVALP